MDIRSIVLRLIGGSPLNKVLHVIANGLPIPNINAMGGLGGLLQSAISGGPAALFQNPIGSALGALSGGLPGIVAGLPSISGISDVANALTGAGGLNSALSNLSSVSNLLSGVNGAGDAAMGLMDVVHHAETVADAFGASVPDNLSVATVIGPLTIGPHLDTVQTYVNGLSAALNAGTLTVSDAVAQINAHTATITTTLAASSTALTTVQAAAQPMAQLGLIAGGLAQGTDLGAQLAGLVLQPATATALQSAVNAHLLETADYTSTIT